MKKRYDIFKEEWCVFAYATRCKETGETSNYYMDSRNPIDVGAYKRIAACNPRIEVLSTLQHNAMENVVQWPETNKFENLLSTLKLIYNEEAK